MTNTRIPIKPINQSWSPRLAYAIGVLTSDGYLKKDGRHIGLTSKDLELIEHLQGALGSAYRVSRSGRGGETEKKNYRLEFSNTRFYRFLTSIGLTPAKSKTIRQVSIPNKFFADFLRGLFDGDGTFYSSWDTRWNHSLVYQISFASASRSFITWLQVTLAAQYSVKGFVRRGDGVYNLRYVKGDTRKLFTAMYQSGPVFFLRRKYDKMVAVLSEEKKLHIVPR